MAAASNADRSAQKPAKVISNRRAFKNPFDRSQRLESPTVPEPRTDKYPTCEQEIGEPAMGQLSRATNERQAQSRIDSRNKSPRANEDRDFDLRLIRGVV